MSSLEPVLASSEEAALHVDQIDDQPDEVLGLGCGSPLPTGLRLPVHHAVARLARSTPGKTAVLSGETSLTYGELDAWAGRIAERLAACGVGRNDRVAVLGEPSAAMVAAVLGVLQSGAAYVPVSSMHPQPRINEVCTDAAVRAAVVSGTPGGGLAGLEIPVIDANDLAKPTESAWPLTPTDAADLAYLIYTSGSTGKPKGVLVEHHQLTASTLARCCVYPGVQTFLLVSPLEFDSSVAGLWATLTTGGRLVVATAAEVQDPLRLVELVARHRVTHLLCIPSLYGLLLDAAERLGVTQLSSLQTVIVAGEPLARHIVDRHFTLWPASVALVNEYGPTETTVWASYQRFDAPGPISIGGPIPGARLYVLDDALRPVSRGLQGELFVGGEGVSRGYFARPDATAPAFLDDPFAGIDGARMFRTGDLVRWTAEGTLEFLGRRDHQVKIRVCRVELGAVEAVLRSMPGVRDAVVVANSEHTLLTGFVLASPEISGTSLRDRLSDQLPTVMVPAAIRVVGQLPRLINGKIDRAALAAADHKRRSGPEMGIGGPMHAPDNDLTARVAAAWKEVLKVPEVPTDVNFFDFGGHSLAMFRLQDALDRHTGTRPSVVALYWHTTVLAQAKLVREGAPGSETPHADRRRAAAERLRAARERRQRPASTVPAATWLRCAVPCQHPAHRLVCFGHAGASAAFFRDWGNYLPDIEVHAVCYPGRAERIEEPPPTDLRALAHTIAAAVASLDEAPLALFGHSMGAAVALETARALEARGIRLSHLFASGSRNATDGSPSSAELPDDDAVTAAESLVELGGTDPELAADPLFQELVLPYVRSDSRMFHAYCSEPGPRVRCPVTTIVGDCDKDADRRPWSELTEGGLCEQVVPGDHFYLVAEPPYRLLQSILTPQATTRPASAP